MYIHIHLPLEMNVPKFDGSVDPHLWMYLYEIACGINEWNTDDLKISNLASSFVPNSAAEKWYYSLKSRNSKKTWLVWKRKFMSTFVRQELAPSKAQWRCKGVLLTISSKEKNRFIQSLHGRLQPIRAFNLMNVLSIVTWLSRERKSLSVVSYEEYQQQSTDYLTPAPISVAVNGLKVFDFPARAVLYLLSFSGFLVSFMMRTDINLAIVAMVDFPAPMPVDNSTTEPMYCYNIDEPSINGSSSVSAGPSEQEKGEFDWDPAIQSAIISSFYWCYVVSQVAGGILVQKFGTKSVFGFSQLATACSSLLIPRAAEIHYSCVVVLRSIQGVASGFTWPAMYSMIAHWIPPPERSRFMSSFQGFTIGIGLTYPICGFIIAHYGWRIVFYTTGSLGCLWCLAWWYFAFDTPIEHPRISKQELSYIQKCTAPTMASTKSSKAPWVSILKSMPAWSIGITTFGRIWVHYTFITTGPLYMKSILGFSIQKNGVLNGAPFLLSYLSSVVFCYLADILVTRKILPLTPVRKIFTMLSQVIPGIFVLFIGYSGCNLSLVLVMWFAAVMLITASYAGAMANIIDIAPNFAGPVLAFAQTIHMSASFISPLVAGYILKDNIGLEQWRKVFGIACAVAVGTYFVYQIFGTSEVQKWNYSESKTGSAEQVEPLQPDDAREEDGKDRKQETV